MEIRNIHQEQLSSCAVTMVSFYGAKALHNCRATFRRDAAIKASNGEFNG